MTNRIVVVKFRGAELYGFEMGGIAFVALKPIVEALGLDWSSQLKRVQREQILSEGMVMMTIPSSGGGGLQQMVCLRLNLLNGWLFAIDVSRVKEAIREKIVAYKRECYDVLHRHFSGDPKEIQQEIELLSLHLRMVTEARKTFGEKVAAQLWKQIGLPPVPAMDEVWSQLDLFERIEQRAA